MRSRLFTKVFAALLVVILLTAALAGWLASGLIRDEVREETERFLRSHVLLFEDIAGPSLKSEAPEGFQEQVRRLGRASDVRLTIIRADGLVLADSSKDPSTMDNHGTRPEVLQARDQSFGMRMRYSTTVRRDMMYVAKRVDGEGRPLGYVRCSVPLLALDERLARLRNTILGAAALATLLSVLVAIVMARRVARPLRAMRETALGIAAGDYERRVAVTRRDR